MKNAVCNNCGWSSGPVSDKDSSKFTLCPICGKITTKNELGTSEVDRSNAQQEKEAFITVAAMVAIVVASVLAFFPGLLVTMLFGTGPLWSWIWGILISLVVFVCCGADWKKYLVVDACIIAICTLLCGLIESFSPWTYMFYEIGPFNN